MTSDAKNVLRTWIAEVINSHDIAAVDRFVAPDAVDHNPAPGQGPGREGLKAALQEFFSMFPDAHATIDEIVSEGDRVVIRTSLHGTNTGRIFGRPGTGREARWTEMRMIRLADGKFVEQWGELDFLTIMQQLGLAPPMG